MKKTGRKLHARLVSTLFFRTARCTRWTCYGPTPVELTYLRVTGLKLGYLLNFGEALMRDGITRTINGFLDSDPPVFQRPCERRNHQTLRWRQRGIAACLS